MFSDWFHWSVCVMKIKLTLRQWFRKFFSCQNTTCNITGLFLLELCFSGSVSVCMCCCVSFHEVVTSCTVKLSSSVSSATVWLLPWMLRILWKLCCLWVFCQLADTKWADAVVLKFPASCWFHFKFCYRFSDELKGQKIAEAFHLWPLEVSVEQK